MQQIPASIIKEIFDDWVSNYGPTYPLYGKDTVRHDISGSIRPLLSSTEISHAKILVERAGVSKRLVDKILNNQVESVKEEIADKLLTAMDMNHEWYGRLYDFR